MKDYEQTLDENEETAYSSYKNYYSQFLTQFAVLEKYVDTNQTVNASKLANNNLVDVCNSLESALDNMTNSEVEAADHAMRQMHALSAFAKTTGGVCLVVAIGALIVAFLVSTRKVVNPIVKTNKELKEISTLAILLRELMLSHQMKLDSLHRESTSSLIYSRIQSERL